MITKRIPISRLKRELNSVFRALKNNTAEAYEVTRRGQPLGYLIAANSYEDLIPRSNHHDSEQAPLNASTKGPSGLDQNKQPALNNEEEGIALFTLGEMRMVGIIVPGPFVDAPDDMTLALPASAAKELAMYILDEWQVEKTEAEAFLSELPNATLRSILISHQLLTVLSIPQHQFIHGENSIFDGRSPWELIQAGDAERVRKSLAHQVFNGGW